MLDVVLIPQLSTPDSLAGQAVIVVDVLRATTTIIRALHNGCEQVLPQASIDAARAAFQAFDGDSLIGGERQGRIVDGFHQGNSPLEYTAAVIEKKTLILATTNGTVAMEHCRLADRVLIGAMINLNAVAKSVEDESHVTVVCSGTDNLITGEDVIFAGALMERLIENRQTAGKPTGQLTDPALIAVNHWKDTYLATQNGTPLAEYFRNSRGGINLVKIGHDPDIVFASQIDTHPIVPELDLATWAIRVRESDV